MTRKDLQRMSYNSLCSLVGMTIQQAKSLFTKENLIELILINEQACINDLDELIAKISVMFDSAAKKQKKCSE